MKNIMVIAGLFIMMFMVSCSGPEQKLIGTWKVIDVRTGFNENDETPEMLSQVVEMQKQTYFRILNDTAMVIISNNNTHEAKWHLNPKTSVISYSFNGMETRINTLGKVEGDQIINTSNTPLGVITTTYEKE